MGLVHQRHTGVPLVHLGQQDSRNQCAAPKGLLANNADKKVPIWQGSSEWPLKGDCSDSLKLCVIFSAGEWVKTSNDKFSSSDFDVLQKS